MACAKHGAARSSQNANRVWNANRMGPLAGPIFYGAVSFTPSLSRAMGKKRDVRKEARHIGWASFGVAAKGGG